MDSMHGPYACFFHRVAQLWQSIFFLLNCEGLISRTMTPNDSDEQHKYCGDCYDAYLIQSHKETNRFGTAEAHVTSFGVVAEGRHVCILALNKVNILPVIIILDLHVVNVRSEHVCLDIMFLAMKVHVFQNVQQHEI